MAKKKFDLASYKEKRKIADTPKKKDKFVVLDDYMQSVIGMPGIPMGHITQIYGLSDSGKSSLLFYAAAKAQEQGILPILIITEGKVMWDRAASMGFDPDNAIIVDDNVNTLEKGFDRLMGFISDVEMGELDTDVMIFWDSIGHTPSEREFKEKADGTIEKKSSMMVAARIISERMRGVSMKINNSRNISCPNSMGLVFINHAYTEPPSFPGGMPSLVPSGGKKIWYSSSLVLRTKRKQKLTAIKDGKRLQFGIVSIVTVDKNHITNAAHSGDFIITADEIIPNETAILKKYKETHKEKWGSNIRLRYRRGTIT